jgi:uncharacterized membrane protein
MRYGVVLAHLILLPLAAWALLSALDFRGASNLVAWLVAAVILHDLVLLPLYTGVDQVAQRTFNGAVNYVRVPAGLSLLLLLVFWSTIRGEGAGTYTRVSGLEWHGYGMRWLLACAALFAVSGALYLLRAVRT